MRRTRAAAWWFGLLALAACGDRETPAERAAALMREEEAFRADSTAMLDALALDTVLVTWTMPSADEDDDGTVTAGRDSLHRYLSRSGLCLSTLARAMPGDTLRCPWQRPDSAEIDAIIADGVPVTGVHPRPGPQALAPETPTQYATRLLHALRAGKSSSRDGASPGAPRDSPSDSSRVVPGGSDGTR